MYNTKQSEGFICGYGTRHPITVNCFCYQDFYGATELKVYTYIIEDNPTVHYVSQITPSMQAYAKERLRKDKEGEKSTNNPISDEIIQNKTKSVVNQLKSEMVGNSPKQSVVQQDIGF